MLRLPPTRPSHVPRQQARKEEQVTRLNIAWPQDMYSLSHVAVPFPMNDSLYGREPTEKNRYGISHRHISYAERLQPPA